MRSLSPEISPGAAAAGFDEADAWPLPLGPFDLGDFASSVSIDFSVVAFYRSSYVCDRAACFSASCASREERSSDELEDEVEAAELKTVDAELEIPLTMNMTFD